MKNQEEDSFLTIDPGIIPWGFWGNEEEMVEFKELYFEPFVSLLVITYCPWLKGLMVNVHFVDMSEANLSVGRIVSAAVFSYWGVEAHCSVRRTVHNCYPLLLKSGSQLYLLLLRSSNLLCLRKHRMLWKELLIPWGWTVEASKGEQECHTLLASSNLRIKIPNPIILKES